MNKSSDAKQLFVLRGFTNDTNYPIVRPDANSCAIDIKSQDSDIQWTTTQTDTKVNNCSFLRITSSSKILHKVFNHYPDKYCIELRYRDAQISCSFVCGNSPSANIATSIQNNTETDIVITANDESDRKISTTIPTSTTPTTNAQPIRVFFFVFCLMIICIHVSIFINIHMNVNRKNSNCEIPTKQ